MCYSSEKNEEYFMKRVFTSAIAVLCFSLTSCGNGLKYLKSGETNKSGVLSQTVVSLVFAAENKEENKVAYNLKYTLHSDSDKIIGLDGTYKAVFDEKSSNGGINFMFDLIGGAIYPKSIAPKKDETVYFQIFGFSDWEKVVISYESEDYNYSFGLKRADYNLN